jgi:tetratricopeptide (TPR) repeat protein
MRLVRASLVLSTLAAVAVFTRQAAAQLPEKFENLKVLPKDIPRDTLLQVMRNFSGSLGVRCNFCHVEKAGVANAGPGPTPLDFKADDKDEKRNARFMMRMTDSLNRVVLAGLPARSNPPVAVRCVTCHRGLSKPTTLDAVLATTIQHAGVDSAVKQYRALRQTTAYEGKYDFSESTVDELAQRLATAGKPADAMTLLQMNQEFYPSSSQIDLALGDIHRQLGEKDKAIVSYRAALQKQPQNRMARQRLTELGVTAP